MTGDDDRSFAPRIHGIIAQPSDTAAYLRGEKVKPTKQIVFYIDNTFPEKWKPYLREVLSM